MGTSRHDKKENTPKRSRGAVVGLTACVGVLSTVGVALGKFDEATPEVYEIKSTVLSAAFSALSAVPLSGVFLVFLISVVVVSIWIAGRWFVLVISQLDNAIQKCWIEWQQLGEMRAKLKIAAKGSPIKSEVHPTGAASNVTKHVMPVHTVPSEDHKNDAHALVLNAPFVISKPVSSFDAWLQKTPMEYSWKNADNEEEKGFSSFPPPTTFPANKSANAYLHHSQAEFIRNMQALLGMNNETTAKKMSEAGCATDAARVSEIIASPSAKVSKTERSALDR